MRACACPACSPGRCQAECQPPASRRPRPGCWVSYTNFTVIQRKLLDMPKEAASRARKFVPWVIGPQGPALREWSTHAPSCQRLPVSDLINSEHRLYFFYYIFFSFSNLVLLSKVNLQHSQYKIFVTIYKLTHLFIVIPEGVWAPTLHGHSDCGAAGRGGGCGPAAPPPPRSLRPALC